MNRRKVLTATGLVLTTFLLYMFSITVRTTNKSDFYFRVVHHNVLSNADMVNFILGKQNGDKFRKNDTTGKIVKRMQPKFFDYLVNNEEMCKTSDPITVLICVYSTPNHFKERNTIRKTWGQNWSLHSFISKTIFLLASPTDRKAQAQIVNEAAQYKDIIQTDYLDSYLNISYKGLSMLKWVKNYCNQASYIVKADDDIYVDIFQIMKVVSLLPSSSRFIIGETFVGVPIIRKPGEFRKEWIVEKEIMPKQTRHKPYFYGWVYMLTGTIINELYQVAITTPVFKTDDLYMTGLLAGQLPNLTYYHYEAKANKKIYLPTGNRLAKDKCDTICKADTWCEHTSRIDTTWMGGEVFGQILGWCKLWNATKKA